MNTEPIGFKGTTGEFYYDVIPAEGEFMILSKNEPGVVIAELYSDPLDEEDYANGKLLTASKKMAVALQMFLEVINRTPTALEHYGETIEYAESVLKEAGL